MGLYRSVSGAALGIIVLSSVLAAAVGVYALVGDLSHWPPEMARYKSLPRLLPVFIVIAVLCYCVKWFSDGKDRDRILRAGAPAEAQILEVRNGAYSTSSGRTQAKLLLEVYPEGRASFQARAELWVGGGDARLLLSPGQRLQVFIDPDDPSRVAVPRSVSLMP
jgi:hypothetical protein